MLQKMGPLFAILGVLFPTLGAIADTPPNITAMVPAADGDILIPSNGRRELWNEAKTCKMTLKSNQANTYVRVTPKDVFKVARLNRPAESGGNIVAGLEFIPRNSPTPDPSPNEPDNKKCFQPATMYNMQCTHLLPRQTTLEIKVECTFPNDVPVPAERCWLSGFKDLNGKNDRFVAQLNQQGYQTTNDGCPIQRDPKNYGTNVKLDASLTSPAPISGRGSFVAPQVDDSAFDPNPVATPEQFAPKSQ